MSPRVAHTMLRYGLVSETFVREALRELEREGWENWVAAQAVEPGAPMPIPEDRLRLPNGDVSQLRERVVDRLVSDVKRQRRRTSRAYLRMVEPARPHLIHAHFGWAGADSVLAARSLGVPLLVSFHGTDLAVYPQLPEWRDAYRHMLRHVQRATVSSRFLADRLRALGYEERIDVLPPGVRLERFPYRGPRPDPGELRLAFIGRLIDWKGLDVLLRALSLLRPPARLTVVGDGPERAAAEELADRLGVGDRVDFQGALDHDGVLEVLRGADVAVSPSRRLPDGQIEGAGLVPREAQAIGLQVVVTRSGGLPEGLPPERRHEAVPWDEPEAIAERIDELWSRREEWPERARRGREFVEQEFSWATLGRRLSDIYRETLGRQEA